MSDHGDASDLDRDPIDRLLDAVFFGPVGALVDLANDPSGTAERGRERVELQLRNARFLGQMVVTYGSKELARRAGDLFSSASGATEASGAQEATADASRAPGSTAGEPISDDEPAEAREAPEHPVAANPPVEPIDHLIADYDDLSASQVVRLLDGLTAGELADLAAYESATRGRRTIVMRVSQLLEERDEAS